LSTITICQRPKNRYFQESGATLAIQNLQDVKKADAGKHEPAKTEITTYESKNACSAFS
jgi:hypothetical protein